MLKAEAERGGEGDMSIGKALQVFFICAAAAAIYFLLSYTIDYSVGASQAGHMLHVVLLILAVCVIIGGIMWVIGKPPPLG